MTKQSIRRAFFDITESDIDDAERTAFLYHFGFGKTVDWDAVLESRLILLIAEAQSGKTYECQKKQRELWDKGQAAFYVELASVGRQSWRELQSPEESERLESWKRTECETATIFMDSYDELVLTQSSFRSALRNVAKELYGHMSRTRIVLTSRPLPVDRKLFLDTFSATGWRGVPTEDDFATLALGKKQEREDNHPPEIRYVSLLPLRHIDVVSLAANRGVDDTNAFMNGLRNTSMIDFMRRPQDVIEAAAAWQELSGSFGTHAEQLSFDVQARLKHNPERQERDLSNDRALDGAKRLALAVVLTQRLTIRHSINHDIGDASTVVDPVVILPDWSDADRKALLERSLFGYASYGRVRFHNTLAVAFLAAERLSDLINMGLSRRLVKRIITAKTQQGHYIVKPSMREVAAWLALRQRWIFSILNSIDPTLMMNLGDPGSLLTEQRRALLTAYVERFGKGRWRGLSVPSIQSHRLADQSLSNIINDNFENIENPEVRQVLLDLIAAACLADCAEVARRSIWQIDTESSERLHALDALIAIDDSDLFIICDHLSKKTDSFDQKFSRFAICRLFPDYMSVDQFASCLSWISEIRDAGSNLSRTLPTLIDTINVSQLESLRIAVTSLVSDELAFDKNLHITKNARPHLVHLLSAICGRLLSEQALMPEHAYSPALAVELARGIRSNESIPASLSTGIASATPKVRSAIFDEEIKLIRKLRPEEPRLILLSDVLWRGTLIYQDGDASWIRERLSDRLASPDIRAAALLVEIYSIMQSQDWSSHLSKLRPFVADDSELAAYLEEKLAPYTPSRQERRLRLCSERRRRQQERRVAKDRARWISLRREIMTDADAAFHPDQAKKTAWSLWRFMEKGRVQNRSSGWNRRLIEEHLGSDIADRLRAALAPLWRTEVVPFESERPAEERSYYKKIWKFYIAAIEAEAEDPNWIKNIDSKEAEIAVRYVQWNHSGFPVWLDDLAIKYPNMIDNLLGNEMIWSLSLSIDDRSYSMIFQSIEYASPHVAKIFLPRLRSWLVETSTKIDDSDLLNVDDDRLRRAIRILLKFGNAEDRRLIDRLANRFLSRDIDRPFEKVWLPALFIVNVERAVEHLEKICGGIAVDRESDAVAWIARLFGGFDHGHEINLKNGDIPPNLVVRLVRLSYDHVEINSDAIHEGGYSPDMRDEAERGRSALLSALIDLGGAEGWAAKHEIASDPRFIHLSDRLKALAIEKSAEESDDIAMHPKQVTKIDSLREPGPRSSAEMFSLMLDRIDDLDDSLLTDGSPRELWATIKSERVMRRAIAQHLEFNSRDAYEVEQEGVTADEKETDIRLISSVNHITGVIELKIGDKDYSGASLMATINEQLVNKYLAPFVRRSGILLITRAERKKWQHPDTGEDIDFKGLISMLKDAAYSLQLNYIEEIYIDVVGLDLLPRLKTERKAKGEL